MEALLWIFTISLGIMFIIAFGLMAWSTHKTRKYLKEKYKNLEEVK